MLKRREKIKQTIDEQDFMQYELAELAEWIMGKLENGQHINIPISVEKIRIIDIETILYIINPKNEITKIHLLTGEIIDSCIGIEFMQNHLTKKFGFAKLDNGLLVNMKMIQFYHSNLHKIYFTREHSISVAGAAIRGVLKTKFGKDRDLYLNKSERDVFEYYPLGKSLQ